MKNYEIHNNKSRSFYTYLLVIITIFTLTTKSYAMKLEDDTYILAVGKKGAQRLDIQNAVLKEETENHLKAAGLSAGQIVWDIGCGNGVMLPFLAKTVGERGHVYAMDISEEQLALAKLRISSEGLKNVTLLHGDIGSEQNLPVGEADLVYMRLILMHVKDPDKVVAVVKTLLKEGGVVASQESIMSTTQNFSNQLIFREYVETLMTLGQTKGVDYDIGSRLQLLYEQAGYGKTKVTFSQPKASLKQIKDILILGAMEWKDKSIGAGIVSHEKVDGWIEAFNEWPEDEKTFSDFPTKQAYVLAWKS
ncbi:MAG: class I SAM-dependent methyltransferase [Alphaproteobacteria bacterium]|nr:class I SAM-dependent methyltransferase [Alphaproteobacteria bacterium]